MSRCPFFFVHIESIMLTYSDFVAMVDIYDHLAIHVSF
jgi:hypothetical protein